MRIIDSHTEGEPTRTIFNAALDLGSGPLSEKAKVFEKKYRDYFFNKEISKIFR